MDPSMGHSQSLVGLLSVLFFLVLGCAAPSSREAARLNGDNEPASYVFTNGRWFDGQGFLQATW